MLPPTGTPAYDGHIISEEYFPIPFDFSTHVLLVNALDGQGVLNDDVQIFLDNVYNTLLEKIGDNLQAFDNYWTLDEEGATFVASGLLSDPNDPNASQAMITNVTIGNDAMSAKDFKSLAVSMAPNFLDSSYFVGTIGNKEMWSASGDSVTHDLLILVALTLPLAFIVFGIYFKSLRMILLPLITVVMCACLAFALSYFVTFFIDVLMYAPGIQAAMIFAVSIDYNIFLIQRFMQELQKGYSIGHSLWQCITLAGKVVFYSGICLVLTFLMMFVFPLPLFLSLGVVTALSICVCVVVTIFLVPSIIVASPYFFSRFSWSSKAPTPITVDSDPKWMKKALKKVSEREAARQEKVRRKEQEKKDKSAGETVPLLSSDNTEDLSKNIVDEKHPDVSQSTVESTAQSSETPEKQQTDSEHSDQKSKTATEHEVVAHGQGVDKESLKWRVVKFTTQPWFSLLIIGVALLLALIFGLVFIPKMFLTLDNNLVMDMSENTGQTFSYMTDEFSGGFVFPTLVMAIADDDRGESMMAEDVWDLLWEVEEKMVAMAATLDVSDVLTWEDLSSAASLGPIPISFTEAEDFLNEDSKLYDTSLAISYRYNFSEMMTDAQDGALIMTLANFPLDGSGACEFMYGLSGNDGVFNDPDVKSRTDEMKVKLYAYSNYTDCCSSKDAINNDFVWVAAVILGVVGIVTSLLFQSVLCFLFTLVAFGTVLSCVYGISVIIFPQVYWIVPAFVFSLQVGFVCDYYVLQFSTIKDLRRAKVKDRDCVKRALYDIGSVILVAGLVMGVSFTGLLFSNLGIMLQLGTYLVLNVLFDCFFAAILIVPSLLNLFGASVWWPMKLPPAKFTALHNFIAEELLSEPDSTNTLTVPSSLAKIVGLKEDHESSSYGDEEEEE
ncbi:MMPL domain-containing protein [Aduncisulcus paluster]|uniref:MMPL domain-containing protein n=1 Tax=Aduncisulcus paluster TaxID=2918883 RepID=A0ABQ5JZC2_9EUKA|nr:MMPL domain-containing protein [Aduncisulcus paluster]